MYTEDTKTPFGVMVWLLRHGATQSGAVVSGCSLVMIQPRKGRYPHSTVKGLPQVCHTVAVSDTQYRIAGRGSFHGRALPPY